jgi:fructose-1,6-bisphosphatase I
MRMVMSLDQYLASQSTVDPALARLVRTLGGAIIATAGHIRASSADIGIEVGAVNVQGEIQKPLDILADQEFRDWCGRCQHLAALVSEEVEEAIWFKEPETGDFILYVDPLDGSSNIDANIAVGSIFSVAAVKAGDEYDLLQPGRQHVLSGYAIYGPSTMLVLNLGSDVTGFTLNQRSDEFEVTHPKMTIAPATQEFAVNVSRMQLWRSPVRRYIKECIAGASGPRGLAFNMRWTGSMVADVHRILTRGGIFLYPLDEENQEAGGKLRLMYEANPMARIVEAAGGAASTGRVPLLDVPPEHYHQRVSVILGSKDEVARVVSYHATNAQAHEGAGSWL